jgi:MFS transporter, UMF1 family
MAMDRAESSLTPAAGTANPAIATERPGFWATFSWALYDLANTIYSAAIVSIYFPAFIKNDLRVNDIYYALPAAVAALLVGIFSPLMGRISDRGGNRMRWLVISTLLSIGALTLMGIFPILGIAILLFVVANSAYQAALMFYDALLPSVSTPGNWGKVSGLGVGLGYLGGITGFLLVPWLTERIFGTSLIAQANVDGTNQVINPFGGAIVKPDILSANTFLVTAVLYLVMSLPCFFFVREKRYAGESTDTEKITFRDSFVQLYKSLKGARAYPGLLIFLVSNFFYSDAVNTVIVAMGVYSTEVIGFSSGERNGFLAFATIFAVFGGFACGYLNDRVGPKFSLNLTLALWVVIFIFAIAAPPKSLFFYLGGPLAGIALGSTWVSARTMMIELTPPQRLGEFMGIYNMTGRFSAVLGPLVWGLTLFVFDPAAGWGKTGYQIGIGILGVLLVIGFVLHQFVPVINRKARAAEYVAAERAAA